MSLTDEENFDVKGTRPLLRQRTAMNLGGSVRVNPVGVAVVCCVVLLLIFFNSGGSSVAKPVDRVSLKQVEEALTLIQLNFWKTGRTPKKCTDIMYFKFMDQNGMLDKKKCFLSLYLFKAED